MEKELEKALKLLALDVKPHISQEKWVEYAKKTIYPIVFGGQFERVVIKICGGR